jgi:FAD/FMN-containing dehydrogenase
VPASWIGDLKRRFGSALVDDPDVVHGYARDWTGRFQGTPAAVVRVRNIDDVVTTMEMSARIGFGLVPQGGNTGLVGATMAPEESVILNLRGLDRLSVTDDPHSVLAGAGTTIASAQEAAAERGLVFGLDMGSRDSATVGGAVATNAGGLFASHWGRMQRQVTGLEAVLADGTVITTLDGATSTGAGIDPVHLLCGSEGTLAVITTARLLLHQPLGPTVVVLAGFDSLAELLYFLDGAPPLIGAEVFRDEEMRVVLDHRTMAPPMADHPWYVLVEAAERHADDMEVPDEAVAGRDLWLYRDRITESLATLGVVHKFDVVVPPRRMEGLVSDLSVELSPHRLFVFGHVLVADFHLNVAPTTPQDTVPEGVDDIIYAAVEGAGGQVAGEHGIGRVKADRTRAGLSPGHRRVVDGLKRTFDPDGRLNPGVGAARP